MCVCLNVFVCVHGQRRKAEAERRRAWVRKPTMPPSTHIEAEAGRQRGRGSCIAVPSAEQGNPGRDREGERERERRREKRKGQRTKYKGRRTKDGWVLISSLLFPLSFGRSRRIAEAAFATLAVSAAELVLLVPLRRV